MSWQYEKAGWVGTLSWHNPPENRIPFSSLLDLEALLTQIGQDEAVKIVVIKSALPGLFSVGSDIKDIRAIASGESPSAPLETWEKTLLRMEEIPQPTVAYVDGLAANGGCETILACNFRVGTPRAQFACREILVGANPAAGATQRLPRLVGLARASDMIMTGRTVDSEEALAIGLLQAVVPDEAGFAQWLDRFSAPSRAALAGAKRLLVQGSRVPFLEGLQMERDTFHQLLRSRG